MFPNQNLDVFEAEWWRSVLTVAEFRRLKQVTCYEFQISFGYSVKSCLKKGGGDKRRREEKMRLERWLHQ